MAKPFQYGGQAVIEGVMMRGPKDLAVAVRKADGEIVVEHQPIASWLSKLFLLRWPIVRGTVALIEAMVLGIKALSFSASQAMDEEEEGEGEGEGELSSWAIAISMGIAMVFGALLFIALPTAVAHGVRTFMPDPFIQNLFEGLVRILIFFGYVFAIGRAEDIKRVFQYHGAEHKVIHAYEAGGELTVEKAQSQSTLHPRCGTSFLLYVMAIKIFVFSLLPDTTLVLKITYRLALVPIVAGIAFEAIKFSGRYSKWAPVRWFSAPGLWMQKLTTGQPDDSQVEVAIRALLEVLSPEERKRVTPQWVEQTEEEAGGVLPAQALA